MIRPWMSANSMSKVERDTYGKEERKKTSQSRNQYLIDSDILEEYRRSIGQPVRVTTFEAVPTTEVPELSSKLSRSVNR